jgi:hypothetical protein
MSFPDDAFAGGLRLEAKPNGATEQRGGGIVPTFVEKRDRGLGPGRGKRRMGLSLFGIPTAGPSPSAASGTHLGDRAGGVSGEDISVAGYHALHCMSYY